MTSVLDPASSGDLSETAEPLAIIGIGCRFPGGVNSPADFWRMLADGRNLVTEIPADRWDVEKFYDPEPNVPGRMSSKWGAYLDDVSGFDAAFFGIGAREALAMDPQQRVLLEVAYEALEHAGIAPSTLNGSQTGVFIGICHNDYMLRGFAGAEQVGAYASTGTAHSVAPGRISYLLGLQGPCVAVDTACSSSITALHVASQALRLGECDMALVGGVTLVLNPEGAISFSHWGMLSGTGACRPFDAAADGFVRSEGCGVVAVKRLADAQRAGDRILAVVRGTAINQDGKSNGLTAPSGPAQAAVAAAALKTAGVAAEEVGFVECHGTGTPIGDPIEFDALKQVYGLGPDAPMAIGSVKGNIGHTEGASGIAGLIKTVLALEAGVVPPNLHFESWNPEIQHEGTGMFVPTSEQEWPRMKDNVRRAGISTFGFGGSNAHAILEQPPTVAPSERAADTDDKVRVFPLSASTSEALATTAGSFADWLEQLGETVDLDDVAATLSLHRQHRPARGAAIAATREELIEQLRAVAAGEDNPGFVTGESRSRKGAVWMFSGQGAQWAGMGRELLATEPAFAAVVAELEPMIQEESGFSVTEVISADELPSGIDRIQPALFAMYVGLAAVWRSYGIEPAAVIGHSLGEVPAAVVAGALSLRDGVKVMCRRSTEMLRLSGKGAMLSVELSLPDVEAELEAVGVKGVCIAVIPSPDTTVIAGDAAEIDQLLTYFEDKDVLARRIAVDIAAHSPQIDLILDDVVANLSDLEPQTPTVRFYTTALEDPNTPPTFDAAYWGTNLRQPVRFRAAVEAALADDHTVFIEMSPHPLLTRAVEANGTATGTDVVALPSLLRNKPAIRTFYAQLANLHCAGGQLDWEALSPKGSLTDVPLPAWAHVPFMLERSDASQATVGHPLLGEHAEVPDTASRHVWRGDVGTVPQQWLLDHRVNDLAVMPGAGYCEMAMASACEFFEAEPGQVEVRDVEFLQMLQLDEHTLVSTVVTSTRPDEASFEVMTRNEDLGDTTGSGWVRLATATLRHLPEAAVPAPFRIDALKADNPDEEGPDAFYGLLRGRGVYHGPGFAGLVSLAYPAEGSTESTLLSTVTIPTDVRHYNESFFLHPSLFDTCLQALGAAALRGVEDTGGGVVLPVAVGAIRVHGDLSKAVYCYATVDGAADGRIEGDLRLLDEAGTVLAEADGVRFVGQADSDADRRFAERLLGIAWMESPCAALPDEVTGRWVFLGESGDDVLVADTVKELTSRGANGDELVFPLTDDGDAALVASVSELVKDPAVSGLVLVAPVAPATHSVEALDRGEARLRRLTKLVRALGDADVAKMPRLWILSRDAHPVRPGDGLTLEQTELRGMSRVAAYEHPELRLSQLDVDLASSGADVAADLVADGTDDEIAWRAGTRNVARLRNLPLREDDRQRRTVTFGQDGLRLQARQPGDLGSLELAYRQRTAPEAGEVEIAVHASSLNFADILNAMGLYKSFDGEPIPLGADCSGVVTAIGEGVTDVAVGDRVAVMQWGALSSHVVAKSWMVMPLPDDLSFTDAAAMPSVYLTAWYGLHHLAHISEGDTILIHSASGGVGLAAIALAKTAGATVIATAGNDEKRDFLRSLGIEHVFDSRSLDFADQTLAVTDGKGVDIVLNSLVGPALQAGLDLLRPGGRFVEIGKRDIYADARLGLYPFRRNIAFATVDLGLINAELPALHRRLVTELGAEIKAGRLRRLPVTTYDITDATSAFRSMAHAEHIGKLVITMPQDGTTEAVVLPGDVPVTRADGSYIVTGGLGGLGLLLLDWLAEGGAGRVVLNGRSAPTPETEEWIARVRANGTDVAVVLGDVSADDTAERLVAAATETGFPVRGVLHGAAVVEDSTVSLLSDELIKKVWRPKAVGAWRLHEATLDQPVDWFVNYSSAAALIGFPGQAAYAAANAWLDGFTTWRRAQGLPAHSMQWGAWAERGRGQNFALRGYSMIDPDEGIGATEKLIRHSRQRAGYLPFDAPTWLESFPDAVALSFFSDLTVTQEAAGGDDASWFLPTVREAESPAAATRLLQEHLIEQIRAILRLGSAPVDPQTPVLDLGFDSLMALELRTRLEKSVGIRIPAKLLWTLGSPAGLASYLAGQLGLDAAAADVSADVPAPRDELVIDLTEGSDATATVTA